MATQEAHIQTQRFSEDQLRDKALELKRIYNREWRARNRKKANKIVDNYWLRKAEKELAKTHM